MNHFELRNGPANRQRILRQVFDSNIWIGSQALINAIWKEFNTIGNNDFTLLTPEFIHASIDELTLTVPTINIDTLRLLHDAGYWRNDRLVLTFLSFMVL